MIESMKIVKRFMEFRNGELYHLMKNSDHGNGEYFNTFHLEGNVWTHSMMVLRKAIELDPEDTILHYAALLHDIGKPFCREWNEEKKKTRFIGHQNMWYPVIDFLQSEKLAETDIIFILRMINLHYVLNEGAKPSKYLKRFTHERNLFKATMALIEADHWGRIHEDVGGVTPDYSQRIPPLEFTLKENNPYVTFLIGVPNSGKSTSIKEFTEVLSRDDELMKQIPTVMSYNEGWKYVDQKKVDEAFNQRFNYLMKNRESFIVDRTNLSRKSRRRLLSQIPKEYNRVAKVFLTSYYEIFDRNAKRVGKELPTQVILDMMKSFELPDYSEFDEIEYIFN